MEKKVIINYIYKHYNDLFNKSEKLREELESVEQDLLVFGELYSSFKLQIEQEDQAILDQAFSDSKYSSSLIPTEAFLEALGNKEIN